MKRDENQSENLRHLKTVCLDWLPLNRLLLCCYWGLPSQSSDHQDKTNYILTETNSLFHQDLLVLILVSYWKSQFFPLITFDMSWVTRLIFPNKSFIKLANWFVPCQSEKKEKNQIEDLHRASKFCTVFFLRLQQIDSSCGFPCMLLIIFPYQESIATKSLQIVWYWGRFFQSIPPLNSVYNVHISTNVEESSILTLYRTNNHNIDHIFFRSYL